MAKSCCIAGCQAPVQAVIRPAMWLPGIKNLHLATETWEFLQGSPNDAMDAVLQGVSKIEEEENLLVRKENREENYIQIWSFTSHCNWLDVVEIRFSARDTDTIAQARSFSTGLIPACCPLSFLFNSLFFWVPFSGNGFNTHRLEAIRQSVDSTKLTLTDKGPTSCC